jgi:hypothetical protein
LLANFDQDAHMWRITAGNYAIRVGNSSVQAGAILNIALPERTLAP